ncbi:MAG: GntR family transcriptional regulator [Planctomycetes bacterium]|nr:GntR family transcriptional regulator [Planctomycetota bacterium]
MKTRARKRSIGPESGAPKYAVVREKLRRQIADGTLRPGMRLPTELELPKRFGVSELTIRRALGDLVREGLIVRRRGSGSFVADRRHPPLLPGRTLRLGLLRARPVAPGWAGGQGLSSGMLGVLEAWGLGGVEPRFVSARKGGGTKAIWSSPERGLTVEMLGEESNAEESDARHPELESVAAGRYDGLIALSIFEDAWLEKLLALSVPTVLADFSRAGFAQQADRVFFDPLDGYSAAVRHFASKGLTRIHFAGAIEPAPGQAGKKSGDPERRYRVCQETFVRLNAYQQEMAACGLPVRDGFTHVGVSTKEMVAQFVSLPEAERPQAVVCHGLYQAEQFVAAYAERGWPLEGAGAAASAGGRGVLPILAGERALGEAAAAVLVWRLQHPKRPALRVGVTMRFAGLGESAQFEEIPETESY